MTREKPKVVREIHIGELAKYWNISEVAVRQKIKRGQINKTRRGYVCLDSAEKHYRERAPGAVEGRAMQIAQGGQRGSAGRRAAEGQGTMNLAGNQLATENDDQAGSDVMDVGASALPSMEVDTGLVDARRRDAIAKAELREMELKQKRGELVVKSEVCREATNVSRVMVSRLQLLSPRLGPQLAAENDPTTCIDLIKEEVRTVIEEMRAAISQMAE